jgi:hypothetical protein
MRGGGGRGPAVGHGGGGHVFVGMNGAQHGFHGGFHGGPHGGFHGTHFGGVHHHPHGFHNCWGCRRGLWYPWYGYGVYDPYWWSDSYSSYDYDQEREISLANEMNAQNLAEVRQRQQDELERTRDVAEQRPQTREQDRSSPATALVFRDRHVEEVQNYAIAGETLWVLKEQSSKKIPLAQLDLEATARMNNDRGVDFQIPK